MKLKRAPELLAFFTAYFADSDPSSDAEATARFAAAATPGNLAKVATRLKELIADRELPVDELGSEANRWFGDLDEARAWLTGLLAIIEAESAESRHAVIVKDVNGAALAEGDSVQVIKDLKVKGGSSDLKRGTLIKKIHLVGDPESIECRVDGSTLVLKTIFLKKA